MEVILLEDEINNEICLDEQNMFTTGHSSNILRDAPYSSVLLNEVWNKKCGKKMKF